MLVNRRHSAPNADGTQLAGLIRCFPAAEFADITWELTVASTDNKLIPTPKPINDLSYVQLLAIRLDLRKVEDARDYMPQELSMIFTHLRLPGVISLTASIYNTLTCSSTDSHFDEVTDALSKMDFPALQCLNLEIDFSITGLPVADVWVSPLFANTIVSAGTDPSDRTEQL